MEPHQDFSCQDRSLGILTRNFWYWSQDQCRAILALAKLSRKGD
jgi:hypothetical protein